MSGTRWSARELEMLQQITTDHPPSRVPVVYNCWAAGNGFPMRARTAIRWQIYNEQIADKATGSWVSAGYICRILGISSYLPQQWTNRDRIPCYRDSQGRASFIAASWRELRGSDHGSLAASTPIGCFCCWKIAS